MVELLWFAQYYFQPSASCDSVEISVFPPAPCPVTGHCTERRVTHYSHPATSFKAQCCSPRWPCLNTEHVWVSPWYPSGPTSDLNDINQSTTSLWHHFTKTCPGTFGPAFLSDPPVLSATCWQACFLTSFHESQLQWDTPRPLQKQAQDYNEYPRREKERAPAKSVGCLVYFLMLGIRSRNRIQLPWHFPPSQSSRHSPIGKLCPSHCSLPHMKWSF